ncbi:unnamed protein product, partial [Allacma fusca]
FLVLSLKMLCRGWALPLLLAPASAAYPPAIAPIDLGGRKPCCF